MPIERLEALLDATRPRDSLIGWGAVRVAAWAAVAGLPVELDPPNSAPHAAMLRRDWLGAAEAFGEVGWMYDRGLMLSLLDDEESLARGDRDRPQPRSGSADAPRCRAACASSGCACRQGPRESTRENPAGLTARQLEVLALLTEGLTNAEIADRLVVSPRTAEHHVAAVLSKLGAATRRDAARRAAELGLVARV